jgi:hypothetical protein
MLKFQQNSNKQNIDNIEILLLKNVLKEIFQKNLNLVKQDY